MELVYSFLFSLTNCICLLSFILLPFPLHLFLLAFSTFKIKPDASTDLLFRTCKHIMRSNASPPSFEDEDDLDQRDKPDGIRMQVD